MNEEQLNRVITRLEGDLEALQGRVRELESSRLYSGDCIHTHNNNEEEPK